MYIFVYGTLKKGDTNHFLLNGCELICKTYTKQSYIMVDLGPFPGVLKSGMVPENEDISSPIQGEIYWVNNQTLRVLDMYEGEWYIREYVELQEDIGAQMYFLKELPSTGYRIIPGGIWAK